jgi:hypothetical protein
VAAGVAGFSPENLHAVSVSASGFDKEKTAIFKAVLLSWCLLTTFS